MSLSKDHGYLTDHRHDRFTKSFLFHFFLFCFYSSGAGRTGLFITMCNVLERLRQESVVDMYQTVKLLRQQRVWMVQTEEQYRFCYITTLDYLNSFDLCTQPQLLIQTTTNNLPLNNSPNLKLKLKSSQFNDKTVVFELDKNYELNDNNLVK